MGLTSRAALIARTADTVGIPWSTAETIVSDTIESRTIAERWKTINPSRIPEWVADACLDAAVAHKVKVDSELALDDARGPWPVNDRDLARLLGALFHIAPGPAQRATEYWIKNVERNWGRGIDRRNIAAGDVLAVLEAICEARP